MKKNTLYILTTTLLVAAACSAAVALAADQAERMGWGVGDPYNRLYNPKEVEKLKATVVRLMEIVPMPGMSPATAIEVREGGSTILVHLCPAWFARPGDVGVKPGDFITLRGAWAEIGGRDVFLASKLKKGESQEFKVRLTKDGTPFWTMTPEQIAREREKKDE